MESYQGLVQCIMGKYTLENITPQVSITPVISMKAEHGLITKCYKIPLDLLDNPFITLETYIAVLWHK